MEVIRDVMFTCCILHNMILEDEKDVEGLEDILADLYANNVPIQRGMTFESLVANTIELENSDTHFGLRGDLIEHLWAVKGANMA
jgi:hypothetical protein